MNNTSDDEVDPADSDAVFAAVDRLEALERVEDATKLLELMLENETPSERSRRAAKEWIAQWGAPPEVALRFAAELARERPFELTAWETLENAAAACGQAKQAKLARQRADKLRRRK